MTGTYIDPGALDTRKGLVCASSMLPGMDDVLIILRAALREAVLGMTGGMVTLKDKMEQGEANEAVASSDAYGGASCACFPGVQVGKTTCHNGVRAGNGNNWKECRADRKVLPEISVTRVAEGIKHSSQQS